jgi:hypothetical protein
VLYDYRLRIVSNQIKKLTAKPELITGLSSPFSLGQRNKTSLVDTWAKLFCLHKASLGSVNLELGIACQVSLSKEQEWYVQVPLHIFYENEARQGVIMKNLTILSFTASRSCIRTADRESSNAPATLPLAIAKQEKRKHQSKLFESVEVYCILLLRFRVFTVLNNARIRSSLMNYVRKSWW